MTVTQLDAVIARLRTLGCDPKEASSGNWKARCPVPTHGDGRGDTSPSLSITEKDGKFLAHCFGGCSFEAIVEQLGLTFSKGRPGEKRTRYEIRNVGGELVAVHVRIDPVKGDKKMFWEGPNGEDKLGVPLDSLPLFGSELLAKRPDGPVIVCEGEKAAASLQERGYLAVATVTGAADAPSREVLRCLKGRTVYLWPDNDAIGAKHMRKVARRLRGIA